MCLTEKYIPSYAFQVLVLLMCNIHSIFGLRFPDEGYYPDGLYTDLQAQNAKIKTALSKLEHAPQYVSNWPDPNIKLGQVSGVALDSTGQVLVFHRASNTWDSNTFSSRNVYQAIGEAPIPHPTILVFNDTGELVDMWGNNLFYMPHGITVDRQGNVWVTDVALHQVFKFTPRQRERPALVLGEKFVPGEDDVHFCKPSAVAVLASGEFFVADGYCNTRILKFSPDGTLILQWGRHFGVSPFAFNVPHALTLAEERGLVCVADRERGRVACFRADNGTYAAGFRNWLVGDRLFSVAYAPVKGGRLYVVNGPSGGVRVRGYVIDFTSAKVIGSFAPGGDFSNPHDVVASPDGAHVYVAELNPFRVYKFEDELLHNDSKNASAPAKPIVTADFAGAAQILGGWEVALAACTAFLLMLLMVWLTMHTIRNRGSITLGRKGGTRRRWEYGHGEFKLRRLLERRRFTRVHSDDSDDEPAPMLPPQPATA